MDDVGDGDNADHFLIVVNYNQPGEDDDGDPDEDDGNDPDDGEAHLFTSALTSRSITSRTDSSPLETIMMNNNNSNNNNNNNTFPPAIVNSLKPTRLV